MYDDCWGYPTECELATKRHTTRLRVGDVAWVKIIQVRINGSMRNLLFCIRARLSVCVATRRVSMSVCSERRTTRLRVGDVAWVKAIQANLTMTYLCPCL